MDSEPPIPPPPSDVPSNVPPAVPPVPPQPPAYPYAPPAYPPGAPPVGAGPEPLPWERPGAGFPESMLSTMKLVLLRPREAFTRMRAAGSLDRPMIFALVLGILWIIVGATYQFAFGGIWEHFREHWSQFQGPHIAPLPRYFLSVVGSPIFVALELLLTTALCHVFLMLFGASRGGLGATFRVICFAEACGVFSLVPGIGGLIAAVWGTVAIIVGFSVVHRVSTGRAAAAVLTPLALCVACCVPFVVFGALARLMRG